MEIGTAAETERRSWFSTSWQSQRLVASSNGRLPIRMRCTSRTVASCRISSSRFYRAPRKVPPGIRARRMPSSSIASRSGFSIDTVSMAKAIQAHVSFSAPYVAVPLCDVFFIRQSLSSREWGTRGTPCLSQPGFNLLKNCLPDPPGCA